MATSKSAKSRPRWKKSKAKIEAQARLKSWAKHREAEAGEIVDIVRGMRRPPGRAAPSLLQAPGHF